MLSRIFFFLLPCLLVNTAAAQTVQQEADLKAAFIYNFTRYVEWGNEDESNNFIIAVLGSSPISRSLEEIARTHTIKNKKILIRRYSDPAEIGKCHILFIPGKTSFPLSRILNQTGKGVLTISEETGYANKGTAFNFIIKNDKLKFEANLKAIDRAGLKASSQLLKLAIIVD